MIRPRPEQRFDVGLQHERTALAWERTAFSMMVAGAILARYAASVSHPGWALVGLAQVAVGGALIVWAGWHYEELHGPLRAGTSVVHPGAARLVGVTTVAFTGFGLVTALVVVATG